jgi:hypothetical protein
MSKYNGHDRLRRYYDGLTPEERFRLDVLALARGDEEESERLTSGCQRETYTMNHRGFTGRWTGIYDITLRMYIALNNELSKLQMIEVFRILTPLSYRFFQNIAMDAYLSGHKAGSFHAWGAAGKTGNPPAWPADGPDGEVMEPDEDERDPAIERDLDELEAKVEKDSQVVPQMLDELERDLATNALTLWEGFTAFCDESVGVPAEKVIAVVLEPVTDRIEHLQSLAERLELEPDADTVDEIRRGLAENWHKVEARGV